MDTIVDDLTGEIIIEAGQPLDITYLSKIKAITDEVRLQQESIDTYTLQKFLRSNQGTCINQIPTVKIGDKVQPGTVLADGPSTSNGEVISLSILVDEGSGDHLHCLYPEGIIRSGGVASFSIESF